MRSIPIVPPRIGQLLRVAALVAAASGMTALVVASTGPDNGYRDDTHDLLRTAKRVVALHGEQGHERLRFRPPVGAGRAALDIRRATFTFATSRNPHPTVDRDCDHGNLPVNRYPLRIEEQDRTVLVGGLFVGHVPQASEWQATYCNSAAITFEATPSGVIDGVRIAGAWDAIRMGHGAPDLLITNSWISGARDDAVENDHLESAIVRDTLIEGAFQGISVKPRKDSDIGGAGDRQVTLSGVLLHLREYSYKGERRFGAPMKNDQRAPRTRMINSIVAVEYSGGRTFPAYWATSWSKLTGSSNNLLLWLSDSPIPGFMPLPPAGVRVLTGQRARDAWQRAKGNWINCHPRLARLPSDPRSNRKACVPGTWGGFTD